MIDQLRYGFALVALVLVASCGIDESTQVCPVPTSAELDIGNAAQPTVDPTVDPSDVVWPQSRPMLIVVATIPEGTTVQELIASPTDHLSARLGPDDMACSSTITSIAELHGLTGSETAVIVEVGRVLDTRQFQSSGD